MNRRRLTVKQHDLQDCGAACLASVAAWHGLRLPLIRIRMACGAGKDGTSIKGLVDAAREFGLDARGLKSPERKLAPLGVIRGPFIIHVQRENGDLHYMVVYEAGARRCRVMDPARGEMLRIATERLEKQWSGYMVALEPAEGFRKGDRTTSTFRRLLPLVRANRRDLAAALVGAAAYIAIGISVSVFLQYILDTILPEGNGTALAVTIFTMTLLMAAALITGYRRVIHTARAGIRIDSTLILNYIRQLFSLPLGFFATRDSGELNSRISDAFKVREFISSSLISVFISILTLVISICLMFGYYWKLALAVVAFVPLYCAIYILADKVNRRVNRELIECAAEFEARTVEGIGSIRSVKHFGGERLAGGRIEGSYTALANRMFSASRTMGSFGTAADAATRILTLTVMTYGAMLIFSGELTIGEFVCFHSLISFFSAPMSEIVNVNRAMSEARIASDRLFEIMDLENERDVPVIDYIPQEPEDIVIRDLSFSYPGRGEVLSHLSLTIPKGCITALTGESGCGKSTVAALLLRDWKAPSGSITIDNVDIGQIDIDAWRRYVSCVPQSPELINGTILENITSDDSAPDMKQIAEICRSLGILDFITRMPMGFLSRTGERGCNLSGGQQQRLALARALYRNPGILILDEATSSLDAESEKFILDKVLALKDEGRTILMITHKKDNLRIADKVIELERQ